MELLAVGPLVTLSPKSGTAGTESQYRFWQPWGYVEILYAGSQHQPLLQMSGESGPINSLSFFFFSLEAKKYVDC